MPSSVALPPPEPAPVLEPSSTPVPPPAPGPPPVPGPPSAPEPSPPSGPEPVRFGFLSGQSGDYFEWAPASLDGAQAAIGEINANGGVLGRAVELVVEDNLSTAEGSVAGYDRIREEIDVLGGLESVGALALLDTLAADGMPTMCPVCGSVELDTKAGNFLWRIAASNSTYGSIAAQLALEAGSSRVALLVQAEAPQEQFGFGAAADAFRRAWKRGAGGDITADVRFPPGQDSYEAQVEQAFAGDPEAVYIGAGPHADIPIIREYIARGYDATILVSPDLRVPDIAETASPADRADPGRAGHRRLRLPGVRGLRRRAPGVRGQTAANRFLRSQPV
ncbi:MAG: ABC transporter substrate-binding protein [bacterium]|nr:ABC transporter substrate-binding protein [bacterium]